MELLAQSREVSAQMLLLLGPLSLLWLAVLLLVPQSGLWEQDQERQEL